MILQVAIQLIVDWQMRDKHLSGLLKLSDKGHFLSGGAILDDEGKMIGSTAHVKFENRNALDQWIRNDPYVIEKFWDRIDIKEVKLFSTPKS